MDTYGASGEINLCLEHALAEFITKLGSPEAAPVYLEQLKEPRINR
jgi:hypothetical protein